LAAVAAIPRYFADNPVPPSVKVTAEISPVLAAFPVASFIVKSLVGTHDEVALFHVMDCHGAVPFGIEPDPAEYSRLFHWALAHICA
jgi:hypothetical protein